MQSQKVQKVKAWFVCGKCNNSYLAMIKDKTRKDKPSNCPYCSGKQVLRGYNDFETLHPDLMKEWDWIRNDKDNLKPYEVTSFSHMKAHWNCHICGGNYCMRIASRTLHKQGCPYCSGHRVLHGFNDLASQYPELVAFEWNWTENDKKGLKPYEIAKYSNLKANWSCSKCSHKWKSRIADRTKAGHGCPKCSHRISKQEDEVADFIQNYLCEHHSNIGCNMLRSIKFKKIYEMIGIDTAVLSNELQSHLLKELDIYIPELSFAIEYDGDYWHNDKLMLSIRGMTNDEAHMIKQELCLQVGIELIFITEHDWLNDTDNVKQRISNMIEIIISKKNICF